MELFFYIRLTVDALNQPSRSIHTVNFGSLLMATKPLYLLTTQKWFVSKKQGHFLNIKNEVLKNRFTFVQ